MSDLSELRLSVIADDGIRQLNRYEQAVNQTSRAQTLLTDALGRLGIALSAGLVIRKFADESIAAQAAQAQLEAAIRSTGGAAGRSVTQMQALASELQNVSTQSDEAVQGAQAILLTFNRIKGDQFDQATRAVVDLATRMGGDLKGAALQVGKALQDPEQGLTALTRSGVSFTDAQKDVIKNLFATGNAAAAQVLILRELEREFGGSAAAARDTLGGALTALKNAFGDLFEIGAKDSAPMIQALNTLTGAFLRLKEILNGSEFFADVIRGMGRMLELIIATGVGLQSLAKIAVGVTQSMAGLVSMNDKLVDKGFANINGAIAALQESDKRLKAAFTRSIFEDVTSGASDLNKKLADTNTLSADAARSIRTLSDANRDRVLQAQQALELAKLEGVAAARLAVEYKAANEASKLRAQSREAGLAGEPFDLRGALASVETTRKLGLATVDAAEAVRQQNEQFARTIRLMDSMVPLINQVIDGWQREAAAREQTTKNIAATEGQLTLMRAQVAAIQQSAAAYDRLLVSQKGWAAVAAEEMRLREFGLRLSDEQKNRIREQVAEGERYAKVLRALIELNGANPFDIPEPKGKGLAGDSLAASLRETLGVVQLISSALGAAGDGFAKAVAQAATGLQSVVQGVSAAGKLNSKSSLGETVGAAGGIVGGVFSVVSAWETHTRAQSAAAREAALALIELRKAALASLAQYKVQAGGSGLDQQLFALKTQFDEIYRNLIKAGGVDENRGPRKAVSIVPTQQDFDDARNAYEQLVIAAKDAALKAAAEVEAATAKALQEFTRSNNVLELRVAGLGDEADALQAQYEIYGKVSEALKQFGSTAEVARFEALLLADAERQLGERRAAEATRLQNSLFDIGNNTRAFGDPRGAAEAGFLESLRRQFEALTTDAERAAFALYEVAAKADFFAKRLEGDRRTTEGLVTNILQSFGGGRSVDDLGTLFSNRQAVDDAEKRGDTPFNIELLKFSQRIAEIATNAQREKDDETKRLTNKANAEIAANNDIIQAIRDDAAQRTAAIDKQISEESARFDTLIAGQQQAIQYAQRQLQAAESLLGETTRAYESLFQKQQSFGLSDASSLSPTRRLAEAQRQFDEQFALAKGGNRNAAAGFGGVLDNLLREARSNFASGTGYTNVESTARGALDSLASQYGGLVTQATAQRDAAALALEAQQNQLQVLQDQKQIMLDTLNAQKNEINAGAQKAIETFEALNRGILTQLPIDIANRITEIDQARDNAFKNDPFYAAFQQYLETGTDPFGSPQKPVTVAPPSAPTPGDTAIVTAVGALKTVMDSSLTEIRSSLAELRAISGAANPNTQRLVEALDSVETAVHESADTIRRSVGRVAVNS